MFDTNIHSCRASIYSTSLSLSLSLILSLCYSRYFEYDQGPRVCHTVAKLQPYVEPRVQSRPLVIAPLGYFDARIKRGYHHTFAERYVDRCRERAGVLPMSIF